MAMEITQFLLAAQSPDARVRNEGETILNQFQEQNLPQFLLSLTFELGNNDKPPASRHLAGILLKNSLDAKDSATKDNLVKQWLAIDVALKTQIKELLLRTLGSSAPEARHTSAQVIAKVASIEIPQKQWPDLVQSLLKNMFHEGIPAPLKQSTLQTLGYVCEGISDQDLEQDEVNAILTAVVQGMKQPENTPEVRLAATQALLNALDFSQTNFQNERDRNCIMKMVCDTTCSKEAEIRQAAFECLVSIVSTYYEVLEQYMQTLFQLTSNAVKRDDESVALQAIEFWSSICDEEIDRQDYALPHSRLIEKALPHLVPMLLETLEKQEEDQDHTDNVWNISMAGGACLGLVAKTVRDGIVPLVMPFVQANISKPNWRSREAATYAFGSILDGPTIVNLAPMAATGLEFLLKATKDENDHVRDTTAWTLSRIFEFLHFRVRGLSVISRENLPNIVSVLLESIKDMPNVAEKVCGAIYNLAQGYEISGAGASLLSPYLTDIIDRLLVAAERTDGEESKLRGAAYETLNEVVRSSNLSETYGIIVQLLPVIMGKLSQTMDHPILSTVDLEKQAELQALLCGVLQVIIQKLSGMEETKSIIMQNADQIMRLFLRVFECRRSSVNEEAMLAIGVLANVTGAEFGKYMQELLKYLHMGLHNFKEYQVCSITVGVISDICRALDKQILPFCDQIMTLLLENLRSTALHISVKPPIFTCIGDIALAIGSLFERYITPALKMMQEASMLCAHIDTLDEELMDNAYNLRTSIFEAYSGILQGFKDVNPEAKIPYAAAEHLLQFIEVVSKDHRRDETVLKAAVAAMGDLADVLGKNTKQLFNNFTFCGEFIIECLQSEDEELKVTAAWTRQLISRVLYS